MRIGPFQFEYQAVQDKGRRQAPKSRVYHESEVLTPVKRVKLQATTQDQARNQSLVAWMVRKHLDYVSKFHFSFRTDKDRLTQLLIVYSVGTAPRATWTTSGVLGAMKCSGCLNWRK